MRGDWLLFSRAGSLVVIIGIFIEYWPILIEPDPDKLSFWGTPDSHKAMRLGIITVSIGTLVWGFGDYVCHIFMQCN